MVSRRRRPRGASHDVQTNCSHYRHICVYVYRVDDFGHVDFLSDGQPWPGAVVARGVDVGNGAGTTAAVGELFHGRSEDSCSGEDKKKIEKQEHYNLAHSVALESSHLGADFQIDYRKKGLLWFSTYKVAFDGTYTFKNPTGQDRIFTIRLPLPAKQAVYDNLQFTLDGTPLSLSYGGAEVSATGRVAANGTGTLKAGYGSQGLDTWSYQFANGEDVARINDFHLLMKTNFGGFDFPENTLSPTEKHENGGGMGFEVGLPEPGERI